MLQLHRWFVLKCYRFFICFSSAYKILISLPDIWNMKRMPFLLDYCSPNFNCTAVLHTTVFNLFLIFICLFATQCILVQFRLENSILWYTVVSLVKVKYLILSVAKYHGSQGGYWNMPKLLSFYYGLFILAILAQSKHLLKKSQHDFTDLPLFLFQVPAQCLSWANEPGCGQMCQGLKGRNHGHSHFQLSAASHICREHCWFSSRWALVKGGRIRTLILLSHSFIYAC